MEYCGCIEEIIGGLDEDDLLDSYMIQSSCAFSILQIGEMVKRPSIGFVEKYPEVTWSKIARFRDVLAHRYGSIDLSTECIFEQKFPVKF